MQNTESNNKKQNTIKHKNLLARIKMGKQILTFGDIEIEKNKFHRNMTAVFFKDVDIEKKLASNKISFGKKSYKYFIGYLHNDHKVKPLHITFPKTRAFVKSYNGQTKQMLFSLLKMITY